MNIFTGVLPFIEILCKGILVLMFGYFIFVYLQKLYKNNDKYKSHIISRIMRGSARWALASKQDKSPLVAVLHANYGCAYLWALKDVFNDYEITAATGIDVIQFQNKITDIQDTATKRMTNLCPAYASGIQDNILSGIAGES
jgi:hypothetical protein